ncbi:fatty acid synthase-like isoform X2 [Brevipalpus obovatus]|uniref:fatty acid synthase-like isoform X2 n=1 Tax=Brevipalpus obovatus TaxID=246614 RepID=UPI003D9E6E56
MNNSSGEWTRKLDYIKRKWCVQEDVVISGMSGRFPKSANIQEFTENLFGGIDMMTGGNDRFPSGIDGFPMNSGKVENLEDFDADFFKVPRKHAKLMDPQLRKLLEATFESIIDAGIAMKDLNGSNTGFYYASFVQETDRAFGNDPYKTPAYLQQHSNIISQVFGLKGPIGQYDTACGSSFSALNEAFTALKLGLCDRALVAGYNICLRPMITLEFNDLQMVSPSGRSKSLDKSADGYGRSEAICCVVLQLRPEAKRIYSTIINSRSNNDGYKEQGITFPSMTAQRQLIAETYDEVGLDPSLVDYVEAHATGTQAGDPVELGAIYDIFCPQRSTRNPLKIGCIKSNMGHSEAASGLCALIKANMIFQCGYISPNIHLKEPNPKIKGLMDGKMLAVVEKTPFSGEYISLNSFGFGGSNAHVILKRHGVKSSESSFRIHDKLPRLVPICSRTSRGIHRVQDFLKQNQASLTREFFDLLHNYSMTSSMPYRGYTLITRKDGKTVFLDSMPENQFQDSYHIVLVLPTHPIEFDSTFENIQAFTSTLNRLDGYCQALGLNLKELLSREQKKTSIIEETVSTVACQLLLINLLKTIKVPIDCIMGDALGQLAYAFTRDLISEEKAIKVANWLGHNIEHGDCLPEQIKNFLAQEGRVAENISATNFCKNIGDQKELSFHEINSNTRPLSNSVSNNSSPCGILTLFEESIRKVQDSGSNNKPESSRIFENISVLQPINAQIIDEITKNCPIGTILIDLEPSEIKNPRLKRIRLSDSHSLRIEEFLKCIGQLYALNLPVDIRSLYPPVDYPVPIDTLSLHSLIEFDHSRKYEVFKYPEYFKYFSQTSSFVFKVSLSDAGDLFLSDHKIDGRILFPATGILMQVWLVVAEYHHVNLRKSKILFSNVSLIRATMLSEKEVNFKVDYMPATNSFITSESDTAIATGKVFIVDNIEEARENFQILDSDESSICGNQSELPGEDIYKELKNRGYDYGPSFRCLTRADQFGSRGEVEWKEVSSLTLKGDTIFEKTHEADFDFLKTWITFSDSVLQLAILSNRYNRGLFLPTGIENILVDAEKIVQSVNASKNLDSSTQNEKKNEISFEKDRELSSQLTSDGSKNSITFAVQHDLQTRTLSTGGLWIRGLKTSFASRRSQKVLIETQEFIPFNEQITIEPKYRKQLENYQEACEKCATSILNKSAMKLQDLNALKQNFNYKENSSFAFLKNLISILEQNKEVVNLQGIAHDKLMGKDLQFSSLFRFLKPFIVIPLNNQIYCGQTNPSITILEHNNGQNILLETIRSIVDNQSTGTAKLTYTLASSTLDPELKKTISGKATCIEWDAESSLVDPVRVDLLIYKNHSGNITSFRHKIDHLIQTIQPEGFLLIIFREKINQNLEKVCSTPQLKAVMADLKTSQMKSEDVISLMGDKNWICVSNKALEPNLISIRGLLFRRKIDLTEEPKIAHISPLDFHWINDIKESLNDKNKTICLISNPDYDQGVVGFMRSLGLESGGNRVICIANRFHDNGIDLKNVDWKNPHFKQILEKRLKFNVFDPVYGWGEYIHLEVEEKHEEDPRCSTRSSSDVELKVLQPGDLSSLKWCKSMIERLTIKSNRSIVDICYSSLNFKDIMLASARLPMIFEPGAKRSKDISISIKIGLEYSGCDDNGNRLMGMKPSGAMATRVPLDPIDFVWPIPDEWTLEDAATVPVVYATVIYGLIMRGNLKRGESVLIHAGSGGVGIAAIHLCSSYDCTIYTTVGTPEKRQFILQRFPHLTEANIGNSRDTSFEELIFRQTGGRGVDIVLNSLSDDKLQASVRCLAPGGRFIEIGKYDGFKNSPVNLGWLDEGRSFHGVMLDALFNPSEDELVKVNYEKNRLQDLVTKFLNNGVIKPLPRTVFEMQHAEDAFRYMAAGKHMGKVVIRIRNPEQSQEITPIIALNTADFYPDKAYIIIGGFGGLGLEVATWLVSRGARIIVINSRSGPRTPYHRYCLDKMAENNVQVVISKHDLTTEMGTRALLSSSSVPIGGIFNSALVLRDALFVDQTAEKFVQVCVSKINITANLDKLTREMCPSLDYFVVFSSIVSGRGNPGQTNYSFANSFMESVCERRRRDGLHGLAIQWGFVGDVGYVVEKIGADIESIRGTAPQRLPSCLAILDRILTYPNSVISSMVRSEGKKIDSSGDITKSVCHILGIKNIHAVDPKITLGELGMDSLMAVEVQQALDRNFSVTMTVREIRQLKICDLMALSTNSDTTSVIKTKSEPIDLDPKKESESLPREPTTKLKHGTDELLLILPPIEGHYHPFTGLFEGLDHSAIGLNWTYDLAKLDTIEEAAVIFADQISILTSQTKLNMIGYSFGGILALAVAKVLEERESGPKVTKLALLDADPEYLRKWVLKMVFSYNNSDPENVQEEKYIKSCLKRYLKDISKFDEYLKRATSRPERFEEAKKFLISEGVEPPLAENLIKMNELTLQKFVLISKHHHREIGEQYFFDGNHNNFISKNLADISAKIVNFFKK